MPNFKLRISGLCGFVPAKPLNDPNNQVRILMPDARTATIPHFPVLRVANSLVDTTGSLRQPDHVQGGWAVFYLADQDLGIDGETPHGLEIESADGTIQKCPTNTNKEAFEWVAPIEAISPGSGTVHADSLKPTGHSDLVARVNLQGSQDSQGKPEASLKTTGFALEENIPLQWQFQIFGGGNPSAHHQALAEEVTYEHPIPGSTVDLVSRFFRTPDPLDPNPWGSRKDGRIRLKEALGGVLRASLLNMPLDSIWGVAPGPVSPRPPDEHFASFYKLSASAGPLRVPHRKAECGADSPGPSAETPLCPPSRYLVQ